MTNTKQLIDKTFYETFLTDVEQGVPTAQLLGQVYFTEQNKEDSFDLSFIRYAQGEIYYQYQDYEAAIFKWENIDNELKPWADKNIGDAYYRLGLLSAAEEKYLAIATDDVPLKIEVALKLFTLYQEIDKYENAYETIKNAILLDPDYPQLTKIARSFYEERHDMENAVTLAVKESVRTEREEWFSVLITYVKAGDTKQFQPEFFAEALLTFYEVDKHSFVQFVTALWNSYQNTDFYLIWLRTVNDLFYSVKVDIEEFQWDEMVELFENTFIELTKGDYYLNELHDVIPNLIANWLTLSKPENGLFPSATVLAWNELFPGTVLPDAVYKAEGIIFDAENNESGLEKAITLFDTICEWAEKHAIEVDYKLRWWLEELIHPQLKNHFLLAGKAGSGKTTFIHSLLGEQLFKGSTTSFVILQDGDELQMKRITGTDEQDIQNSQYLQNFMNSQKNELFQVKRPCILLHEQQCAIIDTPPINIDSESRKLLLDQLLLVDGLLYVIDSATSLSEREVDFLSQVKNFAPELKVHFILNKADLIPSDADTQQRMAEIKATIASIYPDADVLPYTSLHPFGEQFTRLNSYLTTHFPYDVKQKQVTRAAKVQTLVRNLLADLLQKRVDMEKGLIDLIQWNEELLGRLKGFTNRLSDIQQEKAQAIANSYRALIDEGKEELKETIPKLLKEAADLIKEESDFKRIHITLNDHMNATLKEYFEGIFLPSMCDKFENWVKGSHDELLNSQSYLIDMKESFNEIYQIDKLKLDCKFAILEDWRRDINRMTGRIMYEKENILLKKTPAQMLLKGAGKLFGAINQNKAMLVNQYRKYVEHETYEDVIDSITNKVFLPFSLFEKGINQDIASFFREPIQEVDDVIKEIEAEIANGKHELNEMKVSPQFFYDPLKLFEVNLLQQEFMLQAKKDYSRSL
ncbi:hypothetical protein CHH83_04175 [Bacillus sp. 7586-K]|uniref:dynamin family protein n=1 Tax=Metabacillus niabensis TaxID=324854 RepID=UPI000BA772D7|nr:hypothetical protein CHH83_04175 [Bacillus sp. 7586-K]